MDIWLAVITSAGGDETVIGAYSTEELAETTAERVSPGEWYTIHEVLDEVPDWIGVYEQERKARQQQEMLQNQPDADETPTQPATQDAREPG